MNNNTPETWSNSNQILVEVHPFDDEYWQVANRLKETMPDAHISKLWRVQNTDQWAYYQFHKERLARNGISANESSVWHGTSAVDPSVIYKDRQDGFMMQYAKKGNWGRGIYFAASSAYANKRSYRPIFVTDERPKGQLDECELLLAKLLKGTQIEMEACSDLIVPPIDPTSGLKYNTVAGRAKGSNVWIVYENGRAYPDYLVRFYKGARDLNRTPYNSLDDAQGILASRGVYVAWEFQEDLEWKEYSAINQQLLETAYVSFCAESGPSVYPISTNAWRYQVAFPDMMQTNIEHHVRNQRSVRRSIGRQNATVTSVLIIWEFQDDDACWKGYDVSLQHATEDAYAKFLLKPTSGCYQTIVTANVTCTVEFESMLQMEPHDSDYKFCSIRRRIAI